MAFLAREYRVLVLFVVVVAAVLAYLNHGRADSHWMLAVSFIVLALTGLNLLYGRYVLLPVIGPDAFGLDTDQARLIRLFFQPVLVVWALWSTGAWAAWRAHRRAKH